MQCSQQRLQFLLTSVSGRLETSLLYFLAFPHWFLAFHYHPVSVATTVVISMVPKNICTPRRCQCTIFGENCSLDSCHSKSLGHPRHKLGLLLVGIAGIRHVHCLYASVSEESDLENKKTVLDRNRLVVNSSKVLFTFKEGIRWNSQISLWYWWAEIKSLVCIFNCLLRTNSCAILDKHLPHETYIPRNHDRTFCFLDTRH